MWTFNGNHKMNDISDPSISVEYVSSISASDNIIVSSDNVIKSETSILSDNNSKNHTLYNSNYLENGEIVVLNNNDEIIIGRTVLRFNE